MPSHDMSHNWQADSASDSGERGSHGNKILTPEARGVGYFKDFLVGACDLESVEHTSVTREMLMTGQPWARFGRGFGRGCFGGRGLVACMRWCCGGSGGGSGSGGRGGDGNGGMGGRSR